MCIWLYDYLIRIGCVDIRLYDYMIVWFFFLNIQVYYDMIGTEYMDMDMDVWMYGYAHIPEP